MSVQQEMRHRFKSTWSAAAVDGDDRAGTVCDELFEHLNGPRRYYHDATHVFRCLEELDLVAHRLESPLSLELAIWFHDYIYHSESGNDELESADGFAKMAADSFCQDMIDSVYKMIMATVNHAKDLTDQHLDVKYMVDIDLASFGKSWDVFMTDGAALRREESQQTDEEHYQGKINFMNCLVQRPQIYYTDFFRDRYEEIAHGNIARYRDWLADNHPNVNSAAPA